MTEPTQDQLDSMSEAELTAIVDREGVTTAPEQTGNGEAEATAGTAEATQSPESTTETPKADEPPAWFKTFAENNKRELGSLRSLQSLGDKIPKLIEQQLEKRLAALQQAQQNANLSPEDREAQAQLQTQQEYWAKMAREQARVEFQELGGPYIELLNQLKEQKADLSHKESSLELVKDVIPEKADEAWNALFEQCEKDIRADKPGALERFSRLEKDPAYVAIELIKLQRSQVQTQAANVTNQRQNAAKQAAQSPSVTGSPKAASKPVNEMTEAELDKLSIAELEAALPESGR